MKNFIKINLLILLLASIILVIGCITQKILISTSDANAVSRAITIDGASRTSGNLRGATGTSYNISLDPSQTKVQAGSSFSVDVNISQTVNAQRLYIKVKNSDNYFVKDYTSGTPNINNLISFSISTNKIKFTVNIPDNIDDGSIILEVQIEDDSAGFSNKAECFTIVDNPSVGKELPTTFSTSTTSSSIITTVTTSSNTSNSSTTTTSISATSTTTTNTTTTSSVTSSTTSVTTTTTGGPGSPVYIATNGNDLNTGLNSLSPVLTIQTGIAIAIANSLTNIYVSEGVYLTNAGLLTNAAGVYISNNNLQFLGGWDIAFSNRSGRSILDSSFKQHPIYLTGNITNILLDGFNVVHGSNAIAQGAGLCINNVHRSVFTNLIIASNYCSSEGGGVALSSSKSNSLFLTVFSNYATYGAGMKFITSNSNYLTGTFYSNNASEGAAIQLTGSSSNIIMANVASNTATYAGAAFFIYSTSSFNKIGGIITSNYAAFYGGAIYCDIAASSNEISATAFITNNRAASSAGGIYTNASSNITSVLGTVSGNIPNDWN